MAPALLLSLLLSQPKILLYAAHGDPSDLSSYDVSTWEPGNQLFVAVDQASLREEPNEEAAVVASLPLGAQVTVKARSGERVRVLDRVDYWYQVEAKGLDGRAVQGHLFGNLLTPLRLEGDFDGDGEKELATVAMTSDFKIRVRILEPKLPPTQRVANVDLQSSGRGQGGSVKATFVDAKKAGVALVMIESTPESDTTSFKAFVSYVVPGRKRGVLGTVVEALTLTELTDPPLLVRHAVSFDRRKRRLISVETRKGEQKNGKTVKVRHVYQWNDGVYAEEHKKR
jgi:hypothetical protein